MKNRNIGTVLIIVLLILGIGGVYYFMKNQNNRLNQELRLERNLNAALKDSLRTSTNKYGEVVNEKLTLQTTLTRLEELNSKLTEDQRRLLRRLQDAERERSIITAALIKSSIIIDSLVHIGEVLIGDGKVTFIDDLPDVIYNIEITDVMPIALDVNPQLTFNKMIFPNETYIEFYWKDNKKEGYPISFSVANTNRFLRVHNIESYAIPSIQKEILDPSGWDKISDWFRQTGNTWGKIGIGFVAGVATVLIFK